MAIWRWCLLSAFKLGQPSITLGKCRVKAIMLIGLPRGHGIAAQRFAGFFLLNIPRNRFAHNPMGGTLPRSSKLLNPPLQRIIDFN